MKARSVMWGSIVLAAMILVQGCASGGGSSFEPTPSPGARVMLKEARVRSLGPHHSEHAVVHAGDVHGFNYIILLAIDEIQAAVESGGGYLQKPRNGALPNPGVYPLSFHGQPLLQETGTGTTDTAAAYAALIETLNLIFPEDYQQLSPERLAALRIPNGRFWQVWDDSGAGPSKALVALSGMGMDVPQEQAQPGDFITLTFRNNSQRSGVFLGWVLASTGQRQIVYWSSQEGTRGLGDYTTPISRLESIKVTRLTNPDALFTFDVNTPLHAEPDGEPLTW